MTWKRILLILTIIVATLALMTCLCTAWIFRTNRRVFLKDNLSAYARLQTFAKPQFNILKVGKPEAPYDGTPVISLRISEPGRIDIISLDEHPRAWLEANEPSSWVPTGWPTEAKRFVRDGVEVVVLDDAVVLFSIVELWIPAGVSVEIRSSLFEEWVRFPCSQEDLIRLFGPPDMVFNAFHH